MPRHRREDRLEAFLDGSPLTGDDLATIAGSIRKSWERFRRRKFPRKLKDAMLAFMLELKWCMSPVDGLLSEDNLERARSDVGGIASFLRDVACRSSPVGDTYSSSVPPSVKLNKDAVVFTSYANVDVGSPDLEDMTD